MKNLGTAVLCIVLGLTLDSTSHADFGDMLFKIGPGAPDYDPIGVKEFGADEGIAASGNLLIVGSEDDSTFATEAGSVWVFDMSTGENSFWFQTEDTLQASDALGESVAINANGYAAGGADGRNSKTGIVYVFDTNSGKQLRTLTASDAAENTEFGQSMAFDGNNLAIGAEDANEGIGVVYIFDVETGMESHRLTVDDSAIGEIGEVVDFDNGIVISSSNADTAFVFDANTGSLLHRLTVEGADGFSKSVAISGNMLAIGADNVDESKGAVYLFDATSGELLDTLVEPDAVAGNEFGKVLSLDDTNLLIGAPESELAYLFDTVSGHMIRKWTSPTEGIAFADSVTIEGNRAIIAAPGDLAEYNEDELLTGAVYVYDVDLANLADVNKDGSVTAADLDIISEAVRGGSNDGSANINGDAVIDNTDRMVWIEALNHTYLGDSNLDGEFGSADLVAVFTAAEYEDDVDGNSTWAEGDWNGDGDFDTSDLVAAFGQAGFEQGPRVAAAVPEPNGGFILTGLLFAFVGIRRHQRFCGHDG